MARPGGSLRGAKPTGTGPSLPPLALTTPILLYDESFGEHRVALFDGPVPELYLCRALKDLLSPARQGAVSTARVTRLDKGLGMGFLSLCDGGQAVASLFALSGHCEGALVEARVKTEGRAEKSPEVEILGPAEGEPRLLRAARTPLDVLRRRHPGARQVQAASEEARGLGLCLDEVEAHAMSRHHDLPQGGRFWIEPTRALIACDVDLGDGAGGLTGGDVRRRAGTVNLKALEAIARHLRLSGLAGLVVIDLVGCHHDAERLKAQAQQVFVRPDLEPEVQVQLGGISRFGTFELSRSWQGVPLKDHRVTPLAKAARIMREVARQAEIDRGQQMVLSYPQSLEEAILALLPELEGRYGARFHLKKEEMRG